MPAHVRTIDLAALQQAWCVERACRNHDGLLRMHRDPAPVVQSGADTGRRAPR